ncbi:hypothetical protein BDV40DRAFT_255272, partial [Aspergillus tamarii]
KKELSHPNLSPPAITIQLIPDLPSFCHRSTPYLPFHDRPIRFVVTMGIICRALSTCLAVGSCCIAQVSCHCNL